MTVRTAPVSIHDAVKYKLFYQHINGIPLKTIPRAIISYTPAV